MEKKIRLGSGLGMPGSTEDKVYNLTYDGQESPTEHVAFKQQARYRSLGKVLQAEETPV